ncbi:MAG: immunoglobulin domain-containing protein [Verrucomicrobia bacterium]|nr:immunoglobulin domain-containing protein [Verrucomicrobiota bacterium]
MSTARLHAQTVGGLDFTFQYTPGASGQVSGYTIGADGKIVVVGSFTNFHGQTRNGVVRLNSDGSLDTTFDPKAGPGPVTVIIPGIFTNTSPGAVTLVEVQPDGAVIAGGAFSTWAGVARNNFVRLKMDGSLDSTFTSAVTTANGMWALPDGKILMTSRASDFKPKRLSGIARLNSDGTMDGSFLDSTLGTTVGMDAGQFTVSTLARQPDGKLVILFAGTKSFQFTSGIARLNADGSHDTSFHVSLASGLTGPTAASIDGSGRVLVANSAPQIDGQPVAKFFRLLSDGTLDKSFNFTLATAQASGVAALPDGRSILAGSFAGVFGPVVRIKADGSRDTSYGLTNNGSLLATILQRPKTALDGKVFLFGSLLSFVSGQIVTANSVFRLTDDGSTGGGAATRPSITTPPADAAVNVGGTATFSVVAAGSAPLVYQWKKNGVAISGANSATLTIANLSLADEGSYTVEVTNSGGTIIGGPAKLIVNTPPRFTTPPVAISVAQGATAALTAVVDGQAPLSFQWFKNGLAITGATSATLDFFNAQKTDEGSYELEAKNSLGTVRSPSVQVTVFGSKPAWIVKSQTEGLGTITDLWQDGARGVVVGGNYFPAPAGAPEFTFASVQFPRPTALNGFIVRLDDTGALVWAQTVVGNLSGSLSAITQVAVAADAAGNVFATGPLAGVGEVGGLKMTNSTTDGTFLVKFDATGKGIWSLVITGNLYQRELAVDPDSNVILTGRYTSQLVAPGAVLSAEAFGACAVFKFGADGSTKWAKSYRKNDTVGGAVDIYNVAADASGIYLLGSYNQSIKFGTFDLKIFAPPFRDLSWLGKLDANGQEIWLRGVRGSVPNDVGLGANSVWTIGADDPPGRIVLSGFVKDGTAITNTAVAIASRGTGVAVANGDRPIFGGDAVGIASVAGVSLGIGTSPISLWAGAGNSAGLVRDVRLPGFVDSPRAAAALVGEEVEANNNGDLYFAGAWSGVLNMNSTRLTNASQRVFVAKVAGFPKPFAPEIVSQPASQLSRLGESRALSCNAKGGELTFTWLKNGNPIPEANLQIFASAGLPGAMASTLTILGVTAANAGDYTCVVSNAVGVVTSDVARLEIGGPPQIVTQPSAQRINAGEAIKLSVEATGGDLRYQWLKNGNSIPGATNAAFTISAAATDDTAKYSVMVFNGLGTADSAVARVLVCSGTPDATFLGRPWVKIVDDAMTVPGYPNLFGDWKSVKPRFTLRDKTVHLVAHAGETIITSPLAGKFSQSLGALLRWRDGALDTLVFTNTAAPDGTKFLDVFYPTDETDGAMNFSGLSRDGDHFALYEIGIGLRGSRKLTQLADNSTARPRGGGTFTGFGSLARRGSVLTFGAGSTAGNGHYALINGVIKTLADETTDLPGSLVGFDGLPSNFVGFDGTSLVLAAQSGFGATPKQGVFRFDLNGNITKIADVDTSATATRKFSRFSASDVDGGYVFFGTDRGLYAAAPDGTLIGTGGTDVMAAAGPDLVYFASGSTVVRLVINGAAEEILPQSSQIDCRQVRTVWQIDAQGDDVAIGVDFADGSTGIFASLGSAAPAGLQLSAPTFANGQFQFTLPTQSGRTYQIQFKAALGDIAWSIVQNISGDGSTRTLNFAATGRAGFYRVVELSEGPRR